MPPGRCVWRDFALDVIGARVRDFKIDDAVIHSGLIGMRSDCANRSSKKIDPRRLVG
jgi:hypothetical protein